MNSLSEATLSQGCYDCHLILLLLKNIEINQIFLIYKIAILYIFDFDIHKDKD